MPSVMEMCVYIYIHTHTHTHTHTYCVCFVCVCVQLSGEGEWFIRQQEIFQENSVGIWYSPSSYTCRVKVLKCDISD